MPLELHVGKPYRSLHNAATHQPTDDIDPDADESSFDQNLRVQALIQPQPPPPRLEYRSQHGSESIWWVALYLLTYRVDYLDGEAFANLIFTHTSIPSLTRQQLFEHPGEVLRQFGQCLHPNLRLPTIMYYMNAMPPIIYASYLQEQPLDPTVLNSLFGHFYQYLSGVVLAVKDVNNVSLHVTRRVQPKKRDRSQTPRKPKDNDEYKEEEETEVLSLDVEIPKRKKANTRSSARA
jgi:hypothetical protein